MSKHIIQRKPSPVRLFIIALIIVIIPQIGCQSDRVGGKNLLSDVSKSAVIARLNGLKRLLTGEDRASARGVFDFITDPSLAVTILHTLEVAYWTLPMGFLLMPIINFFRIPNRRSGRSGSRTEKMTKEDLRRTLDKFYTILLKAIDKYEKLTAKDQPQQVYGRPHVQIIGSITPIQDKSQ